MVDGRGSRDQQRSSARPHSHQVAGAVAGGGGNATLGLSHVVASIESGEPAMASLAGQASAQAGIACSIVKVPVDACYLEVVVWFVFVSRVV
jgi:hypothetical protein